jgi:hypothetical protein
MPIFSKKRTAYFRTKSNNIVRAKSNNTVRAKSNNIQESGGPIINFILSIGRRCYSTDFLDRFKLRKMSSPFDYIFIDFETSLKIISNNFDDYLHDIIAVNKNKQQIELFYKKKYNSC